MNGSFIEDSKKLLNSIPACTGDMARLGHRLSMAIDRLEAVTSQAQAQFKAGDQHATFNKEFIKSLEEK